MFNVPKGFEPNPDPVPPLSLSNAELLAITSALVIQLNTSKPLPPPEVVEVSLGLLQRFVDAYPAWMYGADEIIKLMISIRKTMAAFPKAEGKA
jgi:hypothetical protein